ncbi:MAG: hypothetical protein WCI22_06350, partial [Actinomycetota bacterium]
MSGITGSTLMVVVVDEVLLAAAEVLDGSEVALTVLAMVVVPDDLLPPHATANTAVAMTAAAPTKRWVDERDKECWGVRMAAIVAPAPLGMAARLLP